MRPTRRSPIAIRPYQFGFWIISPAIGIVAGLLYGWLLDVDPFVAAVRGVFIASPLLLYERGLLLGFWRDITRRWPTPVFALATVATYIVIIAIGNAVAGALLHVTMNHMRDVPSAAMMTRPGLFYALGVAALATTVFRVRDLLGPRVFSSLLLGRYHRPISEERIFLFLDVTGSTRFAEHHGDMVTQRYLGSIFGSLAMPVRRSRGSIDDYIGDMALVSWTIAQGTHNAACLRCVFDFVTAINADAERWQKQFGQVPAFRAALHCGTVVTAEIGLERHKIAYFGDTVNTTSRLESLAKQLDVGVLVSRDLLDRIGTLPKDLLVDDLGPIEVRGKNEPLRIASVRQQVMVV